MLTRRSFFAAAAMPAGLLDSLDVACRAFDAMAERPNEWLEFVGLTAVETQTLSRNLISRELTGGWLDVLHSSEGRLIARLRTVASANVGAEEWWDLADWATRSEDRFR